MNRLSKPFLVGAIVCLGALCCGEAAAQDVLTGNYDNARTNANLFETVLTPANVTTGSFGKAFSLAVDGQIYAQPLYLRNVAIPGKGTHDVVFVATMRNTVYAFDGDTAGAPFWIVNLGPAVPVVNYTSDIGPFSDIVGGNGILGTPVIDPVTGTLYAVAATFEKNRYIYRLHALDIGTGAEKFGAPVEITGSVAGTGDSTRGGSVPFVAQQHLQRPALLLSNGVVYVAFGSHGDATPFHGWIFGYKASSVSTQTAIFNASPNGGGGSFWQSGRGLATDESGNIYGVASNGDTDGKVNFSDSVLKIDPRSLTVTDWFAPFNYQSLSDTDDDLGSCGALLIPGTNYVLTGGKQGVLYLIDKTSLGHTTQDDSQIAQRLDTNTFGIFNLALWNRPDGPMLYMHTANSNVTAYKMQGGQFSTLPVAASATGFNVPFQGMAISANGVTPGSGVLWVLAPASYPLPAHAVLHAYNADNVQEIWNSDMASADAMGDWVKFVNPTVANGKVYVATGANQLVVYGPLTTTAPVQTPLITGVVNAASYTNGPLAPGEIVAIFGQNLGPQQLVAGAFDEHSVLRSQLQTAQITFNGVPGPLVYASSTVAAAIVPYEVAGAASVAVQVTYNGQSTPPVNMPGADAAPGIFTANASGSGPGAILNADYTLNSPDNPAAAGSIVVVYATGGGQTNPPAITGATTTVAASLAAVTTVTIGGQPAEVLYAGNAGGEVAGAVQLNIRVPLNVTGTVPISVAIGGQAGQATVSASVQ